MLFDSHAHLDNPQFDEDRDELIQKIHSKGVSNIMNIGACLETSRHSIELAEKYDFIYAAVGIHPTEVYELSDSALDEIRQMAKHDKVKAIGEIGLDYHFDDTDREKQIDWLNRQLCLAKELDMPVIIHDRDSKGECISILKEHNISNGVMHCFSGSDQIAKEVLDMGFHISFTGVLTFKNAKKAVKALSVVPLEKLLIETDCPYMAPEPYRGNRNHSGYVIEVARKIAEVKNIDLDTVIRVTAENAKRLFGIDA